MIRYIYLITGIMIFRAIDYLVFEIIRVENDLYVGNEWVYLIEITVSNITEYVLVATIIHSVFWMNKMQKKVQRLTSFIGQIDTDESLGVDAIAKVNTNAHRSFLA
jgi:hypothetical protein